jgi:PAS domain S-box-containing protein
MVGRSEQADQLAGDGSEALLLALLELSHDAIIAIDPAQTILLFNQGAERIFGWSAVEAVGRPLDLLLPAGLPKVHRAHIRDFLESGTAARRMGGPQETSGHRRDGSTFPAEVSIAQVSSQGRTLLAAIVRDVSERRRSALLQEERDQRYRQTLEAMIEGCQIISFDWRYLFVNPAASIHAKRSRDELLGRTMMACYPGIEKTAMFAVLERCMLERTHHQLENRFTYPDGSLGWFELSIQPVPDGILILSNDITLRKQAQERSDHQLRKLNSLRKIDMAIANSYDIRLTLKVVIEAATGLLGVDAAAVLLYEPAGTQLAYAAGSGFRTDQIKTGKVRLGEGFAGYAALAQQRVEVPDLLEAGQTFTHPPLFPGEDFTAYYGVPLMTKGEIKGVLEIFHRSPLRADAEWLDFLETLAGQAAIAIDSAQSFEELQRANIMLSLAYDATIEGWSRAMDLRDRETEGHTRRVAELTIRVARAMGLDDEDLVHLRRGALLHDMGKLGVPDAVLQKPGALDEGEWALMRQHPQLAYQMLNTIEYLQPALDIPYCHHEKWDGTGYPRGLKETQIPLAARIFAVVDVWDALRSNRPYRPAWSEAQALAYLREQRGAHFDPQIVDTFLEVIGTAVRAGG